MKQLLHWWATAVLIVVGSMAAGYVGAWFVWNFIYGIGSRVVTDELYADLREIIPYRGAIAASIIGAVACCLPVRYGLLGLVATHILAVMAGVIGGNFGWREGLVGFFGTHAFGFVGCFVVTMAILVARSRGAQTARCN